MAELTCVPQHPGRTLMVQFKCGRCGKTQLEPFGSYLAPPGWRENERKMPLLCPECHAAFKKFMKGGGEDGS